MSQKSLFALVTLSLFITGCSFVELKPQASDVKALTLEEVTYCKPIGTVTSSTASDIVRVYRDEETVASELETLARNEAVRMGGDAIAPITEIEEGTRTYRVYTCPSY